MLIYNNASVKDGLETKHGGIVSPLFKGIIMTPYYDKESEDLSTHVSLCAERYRGIQQKYESLDERFGKLEEKLDSVKDTIQNINSGMMKVIVSTVGTIVVAIISAISIFLSR